VGKRDAPVLPPVLPHNDPSRSVVWGAWEPLQGERTAENPEGLVYVRPWIDWESSEVT